jgi:hypothetical protein
MKWVLGTIGKLNPAKSSDLPTSVSFEEGLLESLFRDLSEEVSRIAVPALENPKYAASIIDT